MYRPTAASAVVALVITAGACGNPSRERVRNLVEGAEGLLWCEVVTRADFRVISAVLLYDIPILDVDATRRRIPARAESAQAAIDDGATEFDDATTRALALVMRP